jgi:hypothetical protein
MRPASANGPLPRRVARADRLSHQSQHCPPPRTPGQCRLHHLRGER